MLWPRDEWEWFGSAGHFICGQDCRFHLCTKVGPWLVSTVGELLPDSNSWDIYADRVGGIPPELRGDAKRAWFLQNVGFLDVGHGRKYETMVFRLTDERCTAEDCACEMPVVAEWGEIDSNGYNVRGDAQRGHYAMCERWATKPEGSPARWDEDDD